MPIRWHRPHKYHAERTVVDGHAFPSKAEASRYAELLLLERLGEISRLELQPRYPLLVGAVRLGEYRGDFRYLDRAGVEHVEDVKGVDTALSRWKRQHVRAQYGVAVELVR